MAASTNLTPEQRTMRARIAALARWSKEDPTPAAKRGQAGLLARFEREVDPHDQLPPEERRRRAEAARRLHMTRLAFASSKNRRRAAA
ncbi:MAG TPA: hypothetical protein VFC00_17990 [Micromonosporaceae bacterium]|nr:hypothetical protein [Micromonosporaceae bacterium]